MVTRRLVVTLFFVPRDKRRPKPPQDVCPAELDPQKLNEFSYAYNRYAAKLNEGVVDLHLWKALVKRAKDLFGKCFDCTG